VLSVQNKYHISKANKYTLVLRRIINYFHPGRRLTANVIGEMNAVSIIECALYCIQKSSECKSINYRATKRRDYASNCQLTNATKTTHPQNLLADENYDNYEPITEKVPIIDFTLRNDY
jgi:precorrin-6B methylase 2